MVNLTNERAARPVRPAPAPPPSDLAVWDLARIGFPVHAIVARTGLSAVDLAAALVRVARWRATALPAEALSAAHCAEAHAALLDWAFDVGTQRARTLAARAEVLLDDLARMRDEQEARAAANGGNPRGRGPARAA